MTAHASHGVTPRTARERRRPPSRRQMAQPPCRERAPEIERQRRDVGENRELLERAGDRQRQRDHRLQQDGPLRRAMNRVHGGQRARQEAVPCQREDHARNRERHAAEIAEHRHRRAHQQQRSRPAAERRAGRIGKRRHARRREARRRECPGPRSAARCRARVMPTIARAIARGTVRAVSRTSPLGTSAHSIPANAKISSSDVRAISPAAGMAAICRFPGRRRTRRRWRPSAAAAAWPPSRSS